MGSSLYTKELKFNPMIDLGCTKKFENHCVLYGGEKEMTGQYKTISTRRKKEKVVLPKSRGP